MDPPDAPGRLAILQLYTAGLALEAAEGSTLAPGPPSFLHSLAQRCVGYVGADLAALCREAALAALPGPVTATHFLDAFAAMGVPSMLRGITASVPHCSWDSIGGLEEVKAKLKQVLCCARSSNRALSCSSASLHHRPPLAPTGLLHGITSLVWPVCLQVVEWPLRFPEAFRRMHLSAPGGVLLHGPPGCAKTTLVRAAATASRAAFFSLSGADVYSPYVGDAEKAVRWVPDCPGAAWLCWAGAR
jgi:SpoVK/Ycf46/Vps4 family AAA+-type ATPase